MQDSIFTKIIKGEVPGHKIYEDEKTIAILTIEPFHEGHTLVIPKKQIDQYIDLPEDDYIALWSTVKKVAIHLRKVTSKDRVGLIVEGIEVPHVHVHLIPFNTDQKLRPDEFSAGKPDHEALAALATKLELG